VAFGIFNFACMTVHTAGKSSGIMINIMSEEEKPSRHAGSSFDIECKGVSRWGFN
jgi:hypothetical protein